LFDDAIVKNWSSACGLKANHRWQLRRPSKRVIFSIAGPVRGDVSGVADGQQMKIRRVTEDVDNFERGGLLAGDPIRIN
jgi:hypothetical protein